MAIASSAIFFATCQHSNLLPPLKLNITGVPPIAAFRQQFETEMQQREIRIRVDNLCLKLQIQTTFDGFVFVFQEPVLSVFIATTAKN